MTKLHINFCLKLSMLLVLAATNWIDKLLARSENKVVFFYVKSKPGQQPLWELPVRHFVS